jgi:Na+/phosphate symporter
MSVGTVVIKRRRGVAAWLARALSVLLGLALFLLALELVKRGAAALGPSLRVSGLSAALGAGWLLACLVLSGSPIAAVALGLLAAKTLGPAECLAMIVGSRLGASFVVMLVGALDDVRAGREDRRSAYIGVTALLVTAVTYLPAFALARAGLSSGVLAGFAVDGRQLGGALGVVFRPLAAAAPPRLHPLLVFASGVLVMLSAFRVFDAALPEATEHRPRLLDASERLHAPAAMFAAGLLVTAVTMSVSTSLSVLVPLAAKGYVRRERVWAYVLGANITTFDDTLLAAALVGHPEAVRIVALLIAAVALVSVPLVFLLADPFARLVDGLARRATARGAALLAFALLVVALPALLLAR